MSGLMFYEFTHLFFTQNEVAVKWIWSFGGYFRVKNTWHQTLLKTLSKETELFEAMADGHAFALKERNLLAIGPVHEALKQVPPEERLTFLTRFFLLLNIFYMESRIWGVRRRGIRPLLVVHSVMGFN